MTFALGALLDDSSKYKIANFAQVLIDNKFEALNETKITLTIRR